MVASTPLMGPPIVASTRTRLTLSFVYVEVWLHPNAMSTKPVPELKEGLSVMLRMVPAERRPPAMAITIAKVVLRNMFPPKQQLRDSFVTRLLRNPWQESALDSKYSLTGIYRNRYIKNVESVFEIIAEPNRRAILSLLISSQQSVGEIERRLRMPQPTVSKHLRVLREAGFVESTVDAQRRLYRLKPEPLQEVDAWLAPFRRFWSAHIDALERHLDRMDQFTPTKRKETRRKG